MIFVKKITTSKEMKSFVLFPFSLYKDSKTWIPPIISEELNFFNPKKNPVFENAESEFYLAYNQQNKIVGRIAVIVNHTEINQLNIKKVRFGWFDVIDDVKVSQKLLEKVADKAMALSLDYIEGPMGFSNMDKVGVQTSGFECIGSMGTWTNYPYYVEHFKTLGFQIEKKFVDISFLVKDVEYPVYKKMADIVQKRYKLSFAPIKTNKDIIPYVDEMFDIFNESYAKLASFVPISQKQKQFFKDKYIPFVVPDFIRFILDENGKIICFAIVIPSFSEALQKCKGRLFPFGFFHLLKARKSPKIVDFYLIGITPEYQSKGVPAMLFAEYYKIFEKYGVKKCNLTPELEENIAVQNLWKNFKPNYYGKRVTFRKNIK